jgi:hypothetical protein
MIFPTFTTKLIFRKGGAGLQAFGKEAEEIGFSR